MRISSKISLNLKKRVAQIKVLLMDVDGTMTDGGVTLLSQQKTWNSMLTDNEEIQCQPRIELAILMTGYLGGATTTNVRVGDPSFVITVTLGVLVWLGLHHHRGRFVSGSHCSLLGSVHLPSQWARIQ